MIPPGVLGTPTGRAGAIAAFELAALRDPFNADIQNYSGYASLSEARQMA